MSSILPVSDLRNYNEVLKNCQVGDPVFLTKNGRGRFVVLDIEDYEKERAEKKLLAKLQEAEEAVTDEKNCMSLDELKSAMEEQLQVKLRQRTWEKASKCQKQRMGSEKTSFDKGEKATAYVGKGKQVSKATYGE